MELVKMLAALVTSYLLSILFVELGKRLWVKKSRM